MIDEIRSKSNNAATRLIKLLDDASGLTDYAVEQTKQAKGMKEFRTAAQKINTQRNQKNTQLNQRNTQLTQRRRK